jgi:hypothetical protein
LSLRHVDDGRPNAVVTQLAAPGGGPLDCRQIGRPKAVATGHLQGHVLQQLARVMKPPVAAGARK